MTSIETSERNAALASRMAFVSAGLLLVLVALQLGSGVTQQWFEAIHPLDEYAARLLAQASWLRAIVAVDDVFIASYVAAAILAAVALRESTPLWIVAAIAGAGAGLLDLEENHHMLALLTQAQRGIDLTTASLEHRMVFSSLKWLIAPMGYCFLVLAFHPRNAKERAIGWVCWGGLLPLTAIGMAVEGPGWGRPLAFARLLSVLAGFVLLGLTLRGRARGSDSSAPRSLPGTQPAVAG